MTTWMDVPSSVAVDEPRSRRDEVVLEHLDLVKALAVRIHRKLPVGADLNDLFQAGVVGLLDAAENYDASKDVEFHSYAECLIKGTIIDSLRQLDWAPPLAPWHRTPPDPAACQVDPRPGSGRGPSESGPLTRAFLDLPLPVALQPETVSTVQSIAHARQGSKARFDPAAGPESQPDHIWERNELRLTLGRAIDRLPERYRNVLVWYYDNEMTVKQISGLLGVSECRISQIRRKALREISGELQSGGFAPPMHLSMLRTRATGEGEVTARRRRVRDYPGRSEFAAGSRRSQGAMARH
jgi:RNA polymerase sigma factor for flagellar operon FliA